jgi:hypothetical protein
LFPPRSDYCNRERNLSDAWSGTKLHRRPRKSQDRERDKAPIAQPGRQGETLRSTPRCQLRVDHRTTDDPPWTKQSDRRERRHSPSPCGRGLGGGVRAASTPPPNPLPQGEGEGFVSWFLASREAPEQSLAGRAFLGLSGRGSLGRFAAGGEGARAYPAVAGRRIHSNPAKPAMPISIAATNSTVLPLPKPSDARAGPGQ